ncbi:hypothetical protein KJI95_07550 [Shewanella sp. JM162201]|uniref:Potassium channel domain-containing protein n=1 Tax=Shewanella jiangmenensis TaxID=2837387 RepID=A0ABS5V380_9GAMM|nr:potassium channel family protein [Shewanella jiangmenensis]MBT1444380.1 hypothetical protein [Shewanella jiangmenensis]
MLKKSLIYIANRLWLIMTIYLFSLLLAAVGFSLLEQKTFTEGLWWAVVTALTIGYGDLTPMTTEGRIMGVVFGHFWIFMVIPMIVANIIIHLVEDQHLFTDDEQQELMASLKRIEDKLAQQDK